MDRGRQQGDDLPPSLPNEIPADSAGYVTTFFRITLSEFHRQQASPSLQIGFSFRQASELQVRFNFPLAVRGSSGTALNMSGIL